MTKVRYNGRRDNYYGCSDPSNLVIGATYEVIGIQDCEGYTTYALHGVAGDFNTVWFQEVNLSSDDKVYMGFTHNIQAIGHR